MFCSKKIREQEDVEQIALKMKKSYRSLLPSPGHYFIIIMMALLTDGTRNREWQVMQGSNKAKSKSGTYMLNSANYFVMIDKALLTQEREMTMEEKTELEAQGMWDITMDDKVTEAVVFL